ncbi:type II secretion system inner membrane protein GspF [Vreelandella sp. EE22]
MPAYTYRGLDADGRQQSGQLEAADENAAAQALQKRGLLVLSLRRGSQWFKPRQAQSAFKSGQLVRFTQQLATLVGAGQPLDKALTTVLKQQKGVRVHAVLEQIRDEIKAGRPLSDALEEHRETFSPFYVSLVRAGEASGALGVTLGQLSDDLERSQNLRGEIINALIYPAFLVIGVIGSIALLLAYVVPQFVPIFNDLNVALPWVTQAILVLGGFVNRWGLWVVFALVALGALLIAGQRHPGWRQKQDRRLLESPVTGTLIKRLETARLARTLGTLVGNGVTLLAALTIARDVSTNHALRAHVRQATDEVKQGQRFAVAIATEALLPELAVQMIEVGENTGTLGDMLTKVANVFDLEARRTIERVLAALVPTLTIVMAVVVAAIMLAIMLPLMSLTSNI